MKKKLMIAIFALIALFMFSACADNKPLAKLASENISIDITEPFDINSCLDEVREGTEVSYNLDVDNSHLTINLNNDKKSETIETDVTIIYPRVNVPDDITIDTFVGYDINKIVDCDEGVELQSNLNENAGELTITYSKGEYTNTIVKKVTLTSSNPVDNARFYDCTNIKGVEYQMIIYPDNTLEEVELSTGNVYAGEWEMTDKNNGEMFNMINSPSWWRIGLYFSDDSSEASFFVGNDKRGGNVAKDTCTLTEIKPYDEDMKHYEYKRKG